MASTEAKNYRISMVRTACTGSAAADRFPTGNAAPASASTSPGSQGGGYYYWLRKTVRNDDNIRSG
jgi:hypothetical protein